MKIFVALVMILSSLGVYANPQTVEIVWPFAPGSSQANMIRNVIQSANQQQTQYRFIFVNKPGAGGSIAANYTSSSNTLTVLASTSSFYTRPMMYHASHDPEQYRIVSTVCVNGPLAIFSQKYPSLSALKTNDATVGVIPGSITQLFIRLLLQNDSEFKLREIPYKGTIEATTDMLSGHIDASVDLLAKHTMSRLLDDTKVLGASGPREFPNIPKINGLANLVNDYYLFVPRSIDSATSQRLNEIFNLAINSLVRENCEDELGTVELVSFQKTEQLHQNNLIRWRQITRGIPKQ